jgi:hypothetical protein
VVCLGSNQLIDHVHRAGKQDPDIGIACTTGDAFGQKGLASSGIANQDYVHSIPDELQVHEMKDSILLLLPRFVVVEVELVDGNFLEELRVLPAELNGALPSVLQFNVG